MDRPSLIFFCLIILSTAALFPTDAAPQSSDYVSDEIVITTHSEYAVIGENGRIQIRLTKTNPHLTGAGLNPDARTYIGRLFNLTYRGSTRAAIWLTIPSDHIRLQSKTGGSIEDQSNAVSLCTGETVVVGLSVDTDELVSTRSTISLHANISDSPCGQVRRRQQRNQGQQQLTTSINITQNDVSVSLTADPALAEQINIRELPVLGQTESQEGPQAVISEPGEDQERERNAQTTNQTVRELTVRGVDTVTTVNKEMSLLGTHSLFRAQDSINNQFTMIRQVDISVPPKLEDQSATVTITVSKAKFGDARINEARIAHHTETGWQFLETNIVSEDEDAVTLAASTPGFSRFAVFARNTVSFEWRVEGKSTPQSGPRVNLSWKQAGRYNVTLTVRDAFNRTDTTTYCILVNDIPQIQLKTPNHTTTGLSTTLRVDVKNRFGNTTITWLLPDETNKTGATINQSFSQGNYTVYVRVEDQYGATNSTQARIQVSQREPTAIKKTPITAPSPIPRKIITPTPSELTPTRNRGQLIFPVLLTVLISLLFSWLTRHQWLPRLIDQE